VLGAGGSAPVILATEEAEIRRITVQNKPGPIVHETLSQKNPSHTKKRTGEVAQSVGPELKPHAMAWQEAVCSSVVECLFNICEPLGVSVHPRTNKQKQKQDIQ
jgi:hypothetical protein